MSTGHIESYETGWLRDFAEMACGLFLLTVFVLLAGLSAVIVWG